MTAPGVPVEAVACLCTFRVQQRFFEVKNWAAWWTTTGVVLIDGRPGTNVDKEKIVKEDQQEDEGTLCSAIRDTVVESESFLVEIGDVALDTMSDDELWQSIPVVKWAIAFLRVKDVYQLNRLRRNVKSFLEAASRGDREKLRRCICKISEDQSRAEDFADNLLENLLNSTKPLKSEIIGNLIVALAEGKLSYEQFDTCVLVVQHAAIPSIRALRSFSDGTKRMNREQEIPLLIAAGFCYRTVTETKTSPVADLICEFGFHADRKRVLVDHNPPKPDVLT